MKTKLAIAILLLFATRTAAQEPWRLELATGPLLTLYDEDPGIQSAPELIGNSVTIPVRLELEYDLMRSLRIPGWISVSGELPVASISGKEVGHVVRNGTTYTVQREDVQYRNSNLIAALGYEILPFLQPFAFAEIGRQSTRRLNQQNGEADGSLQPDDDQDYTESAKVVYLGGGIRSIIPLDPDGGLRIRFQASYANAQSVEITNDYFGNGTWGQHTTGYRLAGRMALEVPIGFMPSTHDSYLSAGLSARSTRWNGDGRVGTEIFMQPWWPRNVRTEWGAFAGLGVFF